MNLLAKKTYLLVPNTPTQEIKKEIRNRLGALNIVSHNSLMFSALLSQNGTVYNRFAYRVEEAENSSQLKKLSLYNFDDDDRTIGDNRTKGYGGILGSMADALVRANIFRYAKLYGADKNEDRLCNESFCKQIYNIIFEIISPYIYRCEACNSTDFKIESWTNEDPKFDIDKIVHGVTAVLLLNPITRGHGSASEWSKATAQRMKRTGITYTCKKCGEQKTIVLSEVPIND